MYDETIARMRVENTQVKEDGTHHVRGARKWILMRRCKHSRQKALDVMTSTEIRRFMEVMQVIFKLRIADPTRINNFETLDRSSNKNLIETPMVNEDS